MDIGFFINYDNQVVQFPVNPEKVTVSCKGNNSTSEIIKLGQINLLKDRKLKEISFKSFFPYGPDNVHTSSWFPAIRTLGEFQQPDFYKSFFEGIMNDKKPCRLVITGLNITLKCSIESFEYYHQAGDHEDAYYSLSLKEYRDYTITEIGVDSSLLRGVSALNASSANSNASSALVNSVTPTEITVGCDVILNGTVHRDSYGSKPGKTFKNYKGKVNLINKKGSHPYHITTPSGGWLGWVTAESVVLT